MYICWVKFYGLYYNLYFNEVLLFFKFSEDLVGVFKEKEFYILIVIFVLMFIFIFKKKIFI